MRVATLLTVLFLCAGSLLHGDNDKAYETFIDRLTLEIFFTQEYISAAYRSTVRYEEDKIVIEANLDHWDDLSSITVSIEGEKKQRINFKKRLVGNRLFVEIDKTELSLANFVKIKNNTLMFHTNISLCVNDDLITTHDLPFYRAIKELLSIITTPDFAKKGAGKPAYSKVLSGGIFIAEMRGKNIDTSRVQQYSLAIIRAYFLFLRLPRSGRASNTAKKGCGDVLKTLRELYNELEKNENKRKEINRELDFIESWLNKL